MQRLIQEILDRAAGMLAPEFLGEERRFLQGLRAVRLVKGRVDLRVDPGRNGLAHSRRLRRRLEETMSAILGVDLRLRFVRKDDPAADPFRDRPLVDAGNRTAWLLLRGLAERRDPLLADMNPIFFFGGPGVGKTYLIRWFLRRAGVPAMTFDALDLHGRIARRLREGGLPALRRGLARARLFVLDEVHRLQGKFRTQEEVASLCDELRARGCLLLMAGRHHPREIHRLGPKLSSRFLGGFVVEVGKPGLELRRRFAERLGLRPGAEREALVRRSGSFGDILGELAAGTGLGTASGKPGEQEFERLVASLESRVAECFGCEREALRNGETDRRSSTARQVLAYLAREAGLSGASIARRLGWKSASSVHYALKKVRARLDSDPAFLKRVERCR